MFSCPKILFLVSLLFVALLNPKLNPYLLFKFLIFYHSSINTQARDLNVAIATFQITEPETLSLQSLLYHTCGLEIETVGTGLACCLCQSQAAADH